MNLIVLFAWMGVAIIGIYYGGFLVSGEFKQKISKYSTEYYLAYILVYISVLSTILGLFYLTYKFI